MIKIVIRKDRIRKMFLVLAMLSVLSGISGCSKLSHLTEDENKNRITIVATVFPYFDFARAIAGDEAEIKLLLPPGRDSHCYEPSAYDLLEMQQADVLLYNGGEMETWVDAVLEAIPRTGKITFCALNEISLLEEVHTKSMKSDSHHHEEEEEAAEEASGHHHEDEYDEHIWTSPVNAKVLTQAIAELLCEAYPDRAELFQENAKEYLEELEQVDQEIRDITTKAKHHKLLFADRFPFLYFTHEYGLDFDAAFSGCAGDTEPSAAVIASLIEEIRTEAFPAVFYVENGNTKTAQMLQEVTGTQILLLHSCHTVTAKEIEDGVRYVDLMRRNAENLRIGLN